MAAWWLPFCPCQLMRFLLSPQGLLLIGSAVLIFALVAFFLLRFISQRYPQIQIFNSERYYHDPRSDERHPLPQLGTVLLAKDQITYSDLAPATLYLSVIVPAYNEQERLPLMLDEALDYLEQRKCRYEVIIVDDGSKDNTTQVALDYVQKFGADKVRVITLEKNRGKGGAIRIGILAARGEFCLFADADGATKFADVAKLEKWIFEQKQKYDDDNQEEDDDDNPDEDQFNPQEYPMAIGSRAHLQQEAIAKRSFFRTILMKGFHWGVWLLTVRTVQDTQCGFKLLPRRVAHILFAHMHVERWAFDVELLLLAERLRLPIGEVPVRWTEIEGSKLVPVLSWLQMGRDVALIWLLYFTGAYAYPTPPFTRVHALTRASRKKKAP